MIQNSNFYEIQTDEGLLLVPFGVEAAMHRRIVALKGTADEIWHSIATDIDEDTLLEHMYEFYETEDSDDVKLVRTDTRFTLFKLQKWGALWEHPQEPADIVSEDVIVHDGGDAYELSFPQFESVKSIRVSKNQADEQYDLEEIATLPREEMLSKRFGFGIKALEDGKIFLHSCSFLYKGKLWLISAPAGVGKSTHTKMWEDAGDGVIVNGDLNLIGVKNGKPYAYGTPWCGTSEVYDLKTYPIGGIILLRRGYTDYIKELTYMEKLQRLLARVVTPIWDRKQTAAVVKHMKKVIAYTPVFALYATTDIKTQKTLKDYLDAHVEWING